MSTTTTVSNGKPRRQLADQLDRLDEQLDRVNGVIDALAEGLNAAVSDAAQAGVKVAVQAAVVELLTNADLRATLHRASAPPAPEKVSAWTWLKTKVRQVTTKVKEATAPLRAAVAAKLEAVKEAASGATAPAWMLWRLRKAALLGLGVGVLVAGLAYAGSHGLAALLSGVGAAVTTVAVQGGLLVRQAVRRLKLV